MPKRPGGRARCPQRAANNRRCLLTTDGALGTARPTFNRAGELGNTPGTCARKKASSSNSHFVRLVGRVTPCAPVLARIFHRAFGFWRLGRILGARVGHGGLFLPRDRWVRREKPVRQATRPFLKTPLLRFLPTVAPFALSPPVRPVASAVDGKGQRALVAGRRCSSAHTLGVRSRAPGRLFLRA